MRALPHPQESERLAALRRFQILDTAIESDFDEIVRLAADICQVPVSLISLVDAERQWFKARVGLEQTETPRDVAICSHVILQDQLVEFSDTSLDERTSDNPLTQGEEGFGFYAGVPLITSDNLPLGTLCVLDRQPRQLNEMQRNALKVLGNQVMRQLELREVIAREEVLRKEIDHRVKNSLQTISSFVSLEKRATQNAEAKAVLSSVEQQIATVALLHQQIGVGLGEEIVALDQFLNRVTELLDLASPASVTVSGSYPAMMIPVRTAAILATIVNELAANAVKHAFEAKGGTVRFDATLEADGLVLVCTDDGIGAVTSAEASKRQGLGMSILKASVNQMAGTMAIERGDWGSRTEIRTPIKDCHS